MSSFKISVKEFVSRTNAISLEAKAGRYVWHDCQAMARSQSRNSRAAFVTMLLSMNSSVSRIWKTSMPSSSMTECLKANVSWDSTR